ncbi:MAG: 50S ribosomal protein L17 [Candidatus Binatia bacterium]
MRHLKAGRKLNRSAAHRKALLRNLVTALLEHEQVRTTDAKAKELRRIADRMITLGKRGTLQARRQALSYVRQRRVVRKLFDEVADRFGERPGGYTRVVKLGHRHGDAAPMSIIELTDRGEASKAEAERKRERRRRRAEKKAESPAMSPMG